MKSDFVSKLKELPRIWKGWLSGRNVTVRRKSDILIHSRVTIVHNKVRVSEK